VVPPDNALPHRAHEEDRPPLRQHRELILNYFRLLQPGDRILAINDDRRAARIGPQPFLHFFGPGTDYDLTILRGGIERRIRCHIGAVPSTVAIPFTITFLLVSVSFFLMAMLMGLLRPEDRVTRLGCVAGLWVAWRMFAYAMVPLRSNAVGIERIFRDLEPALELGILVLGFHFMYRLSGIRGERIWPVLLVLFYLVCGAISVLDLAVGLFMVQGRERALALLDRYPLHLARPLVIPILGLYMVIPLAMCVVIVRGYLIHRDPAYRRRLRWVVVGLLTAVAPVVASTVANLLRLPFPMASAHRDVFIVLIPVTLGYAVVKHQVMGLEVVIRQGVRYLLARNVLYAVLVLPMAGLVLPFIRHPERSVAEIVSHNPVFLNLVLAVAVSAGLKYRRQLQTWVGRRFFREVYNQEQILHRLIEKVASTHSLPEISHIVSDEVNSALHPRSVHLYYRERASSGLLLGHSSTGTARLCVPDGSELVAVLEMTRKAIVFPCAGFETERSWLDGLAARLIVPIIGSRPPLAGLLLLGEKKSEEPYSPSDKSLLQSLAGQMALVSENVWLQERLDEESRIRHEVLARLDQSEVKLLRECPRCHACYDSDAAACSADGSELTVTLPVERVIEGKYRLESRIGRGGMGAVYVATDLRLNRSVAVKIMTGGLFGNRSALRRFEREARATAQLMHPNIVAIHDYGRVGSDGAYLVMERVPGCTWCSALERRKRLAPEIAAWWFDQLLGGLQAAHAAGIVHRDLKPDNVLVDRDCIKILAKNI
jgi:eukaryotic-like serine/threonine-protein kinase